MLNDLSFRTGAIAAIGSDTDAPGERYAKRIVEIVEAANVPWERCEAPGGANEWNKFLKIQAGRGGGEANKTSVIKL
jgi:hypothetical protein